MPIVFLRLLASGRMSGKLAVARRVRGSQERCGRHIRAGASDGFSRVVLWGERPRETPRPPPSPHCARSPACRASPAVCGTSRPTTAYVWPSPFPGGVPQVPPARSRHASLSPSSLGCVLLSRFCQIPPSVDNHRLCLLLNSFPRIHYPGLLKTRFWFGFPRGLVGGRSEAHYEGGQGRLTLHFGKHSCGQLRFQRNLPFALFAPLIHS